MVFFIELLFFVLALAMIAVGESVSPRLALGITLALLALSALGRWRYQRAGDAAWAPTANPGPQELSLQGAAPAAGGAESAEEGSERAATSRPAAPPRAAALARDREREAREAALFRAELLRSWRHLNMLLVLGAGFLLIWAVLSR